MCLTRGYCANDLLETMQKQILPPGLSLNLVEDEGKVLREVAQGEVTERVTSRRLDLLRVVTERAEDSGLEVLEGAEVRPSPNLPDSEEAEGEAVVLLGGGEGGHELLDHHHGLSGRVTHQAGYTLGNIGSASLKIYVDELIIVNLNSIPCECCLLCYRARDGPGEQGGRSDPGQAPQQRQWS